MTGRELIIYILENSLDDEPIFENGKLLGFLNVHEAALKFNVGTATIELWYELGILNGLKIEDNIYIPYNEILSEIDMQRLKWLRESK